MAMKIKMKNIFGALGALALVLAHLTKSLSFDAARSA